jgi:hypothetical protein
MRTTTASATLSEATYRAALMTVLIRLGPDDARSLRSYALRFLEHCLKEGIDPLLPGATAFEQFSADLSEGQRWRFAHAARRVLAQVGQPAHLHGLGLGDQSHLVREALNGPARDAVVAVIDRANGREGVWKSALGRLFAFCRDEGWEPLDLDPADLDDFRDWLVRLGLERTWEIRQVAKVFLEILNSEGLTYRTTPPRCVYPRPGRAPRRSEVIE